MARPAAPCAALVGPFRSLKEQATDAYVRRDYLRSGQLFVAAAEQGDDVASSFYNAASSFALAGRSDEAFSALESDRNDRLRDVLAEVIG